MIIVAISNKLTSHSIQPTRQLIDTLREGLSVAKKVIFKATQPLSRMTRCIRLFRTSKAIAMRQAFQVNPYLRLTSIYRYQPRSAFVHPALQVRLNNLC